jgi:hypothetical protein
MCVNVSSFLLVCHVTVTFREYILSPLLSHSVLRFWALQDVKPSLCKL